MSTNTINFAQLEARLSRWLAPHQPRFTALSHDLLRISLGLVFLLFGALKFVPGLSPAEDMAVRAVTELTFGLVPAGLALVLVALLETTIGVCLVTGRGLRLGLALLGGAMVGILSPLVLFPAELFAGPFFAPTLAGQYVIKDIVLLSAALVIAVHAFSRRPAARPVIRPAARPEAGPTVRDPRPRPAPKLDLDLDSNRPSRGLIATALLLALIVGTFTSLVAVAIGI